MEYAYPAAALAIGVLLYWRHPGAYVSFTWWIWFLTPEVRRLVEYVQGYKAINPVMLAPYLVSALVFFTLLYHLPKLRLKRFFPFVLLFLGMFYAYAVGVYHAGVFGATYGLLEWSVPVLFAFFLIVHWRQYPVFRRSMQRTFVKGILVMGAYGLVQFFVLPPWDKYWMLNAPINSIGYPEPMEVRVFSTLNSSAPFAVVMMAGLLLLFGGGGFLRWPAAAVGYVSFLLSLVRSAWGGWVVALLFILVRRGRLRLGLLVTVGVMALAALPLLTIGPVADTIDERVATFSDLGEDNSFRARVDFYREYVPQSLLNPIGEGLGSTGRSTKLNTEGEIGELDERASFDSGVMELPFLLGWPGSMLYVGGMVWLLLYGLRSSGLEDFFAVASRGIVVALLGQLIFDDMTIGLPGMLFWSFLALAIAAEVNRRDQISRGRVSGGPESRYGDTSARPKGVIHRSHAGRRRVGTAPRRPATDHR